MESTPNEETKSILPQRRPYSDDQKALAGFAGIFLGIDIITIIMLCVMALPCTEDYCDDVMKMFWAVIIYSLIDGSLNSIAIYATFNAMPKIIRPWLIYRGVALVLGLIIQIYNINQGNWDAHSLFYSFTFIVFTIFSILRGKWLVEDMEDVPSSYRRYYVQSS